VVRDPDHDRQPVPIDSPADRLNTWLATMPPATASSGDLDHALSTLLAAAEVALARELFPPATSSPTKRSEDVGWWS